VATALAACLTGAQLASARAQAEPGSAPAAPAPVVITEVLAHTDPPDVDFVELHNPGDRQADIGGWFLTDDAGQPRRYRIPAGTVMPPHGYRVFTQQQLGFGLSELGERVYLYAPGPQGDLIQVNRVDFGASPNGQSFGRYPISTGEIQFPLQQAPTPGAANAGPWVAPIVLAEIMYDPPTGGEYLIVANRTGLPQPLFDPERPGHRWQIDGVDFTFPPDLVLGPFARLIVADEGPDRFRAEHSLPPETPVVGPFNGKLSNGGERLALRRPQPPELDGYVPSVDVDVVEYGISAPWPTAEEGMALQRIEIGAYGNDPANWRAGVTDLATVGTPAAAFSVYLPAVLR
jgi:hypothetical protein